MRMEVLRTKIHIIPENPTDEAYIEEVLRLNKEGEWCGCQRINAMNLSRIAYLSIEKQE